eukprot:scaffold93044_cov62-Phaeocystis_antarctica.AAC.2
MGGAVKCAVSSCSKGGAVAALAVAVAAHEAVHRRRHRGIGQPVHVSVAPLASPGGRPARPGAHLLRVGRHGHSARQLVQAPHADDQRVVAGRAPSAPLPCTGPSSGVARLRAVHGLPELPGVPVQRYAVERLRSKAREPVLVRVSLYRARRPLQPLGEHVEEQRRLRIAVEVHVADPSRRQQLCDGIRAVQFRTQRGRIGNCSCDTFIVGVASSGRSDVATQRPLHTCRSPRGHAAVPSHSVSAAVRGVGVAAS